MKYNLPIFSVLAISLMSGVSVPSLKASEADKKTTITISQPVAVQGTILPAGQYVLRLRDYFPMRDVVSIFNSDETRLITTVAPLHATREQLADKSEFSFYGSSEGQPVALHTWFYPGDSNGYEFLQAPNAVVAGSSANLAVAKKTPARSPRHAAAAQPSATGG
jgi:hypothetical protein